MTTCSPVKHQERKYIAFQTLQPQKHHAQRISDMSVGSFNLHTTMKIPPDGK